VRANSYFAEGHGKGANLDEEEKNEKYSKKKKKNDYSEGIKKHGSLLMRLGGWRFHIRQEKRYFARHNRGMKIVVSSDP